MQYHCSPVHYCRYMTASCLMDYDTLAVADKFGNIAIVSVVMGCMRWGSSAGWRTWDTQFSGTSLKVN